MISKKSMLPRETGLEMLSLLPAVSAQKRPRETESRFPSAVSAEFPSRCPLPAAPFPLPPGSPFEARTEPASCPLPRGSGQSWRVSREPSKPRSEKQE